MNDKNKNKNKNWKKQLFEIDVILCVCMCIFFAGSFCFFILSIFRIQLESSLYMLQHIYVRLKVVRSMCIYVSISIRICVYRYGCICMYI